MATASRALHGSGGRAVSEEKRVLVQQAADQLHYRIGGVAKRPAADPGREGRRTYAIGLVLGNVSYKFSDPFWSPVLDGVDGELIRQRYRLLFTHTVDDLRHARQRRLLSRSHIDGLILVGGLRPFGHAIGLDRMVLIEGGDDRLRWEDPLRIDVISMEKTRAMFRLIDHLISLGHRRIGFLGPPASLDERAVAFPQALARHGLAVDPAHVAEAPWSAEGAYAVALPFLRQRGAAIDALICGCDTMAIGAMRAARECAIRLPEDLAITGFDDIAFARDLEPPLTTVSVPKELMGQLAARRLLERIAQPDLPPIIQTVPTSLVIRGSCGAPRPNVVHEHEREHSWPK